MFFPDTPGQETTQALRLQRLQPINAPLRKDDKKCGKYFISFDCQGEAAFHYLLADQDSLFVKMGKDNPPVLAFQASTKVVLDETKKVPTVEHPKRGNDSSITTIIRLNSRDYETSKACIPSPGK